MKNIIVFYDPRSTAVACIKDHLDAFTAYSRHNVFYCPATLVTNTCPNLDLFDCAIIHYSIRVSVEGHLNVYVAKKIREWGGLKLLFIQDEYEGTNIAKQYIRDLGIQVVYTCVPDKYVNYVYPRNEFPAVEFVNNLTGYVPDSLLSRQSVKPHSERKIEIGYRGRELPYWYGTLGREKFLIGKIMRSLCDQHKVPCDIEWDHDKRILGPSWFDFLESCKFTLGTESGSNVFDFDGDLKKEINAWKSSAGDALSYDEVYEKLLRKEELHVRMNQISPKIFEAISLRTGLILFEGEYSGVVQPYRHFIPLKKDFSNIEEVFNLMKDEKFVSNMIVQAYDDVIKSGRWSFKSFIESVDSLIDGKVSDENHVGLEIVYVGGVVRENCLLTNLENWDRGVTFNSPISFSQFNDVEGIDKKALIKDFLKKAAIRRVIKAIDLIAPFVPVSKSKLHNGVFRALRSSYNFSRFLMVCAVKVRRLFKGK